MCAVAQIRWLCDITNIFFLHKSAKSFARLGILLLNALKPKPVIDKSNNILYNLNMKRDKEKMNFRKQFLAKQFQGNGADEDVIVLIFYTTRSSRSDLYGKRKC